MALRKILTEGDEQLLKHSRKVEKFDDRLHTLIDDMRETLENSGGVGLAAPQVGILKRIVVIDTGEEGECVTLVNPVITLKEGEQVGEEGCLSLPGKSGVVTRSNHVVVRAYDENMELYELEGTELLARAIQHECDHLDGIMYVDKVEGRIYDNEELEDE